MNQLTNFKVLPKFVGIWQGNWQVLDSQGKELYRFTSLISQKIVNNQWVQTNEHNYSDGRQETLHFFGEVMGENQLLLSSPDSPYSEFKMLVSELGDHLIIIQVSHQISGIALTTETINLVSPTERIRTLQQFNIADGKNRGFCLVFEKKVSNFD